MQARDLKGRAVLTLSDATKVGQVDDVLFDPDFRRILGFRVKHGGLLSKTAAVTRDNVSSIGADAVTVQDAASINEEKRFPTLAEAATLEQAEGTKVVTEGGTLLGTVNGVEIDDEARTVNAYVLSVSLLERLQHHAPTVRADQVIRLGDGGIMIVPDSVGAELTAS